MAGRENRAAGFTERDFYLAEFRGRTLAIALRSGRPQGLETLRGVIGELVGNATRVVLLSPDPALIEAVVGCEAIEVGSADWVGHLWRRVRDEGQVGLVLSNSHEFAAACHGASQRLGFAKLVWVDEPPVLATRDGEAASYIDRKGLDRLLAGTELAPERRALLREIHAMIDGGLPAVNVCSLQGLDEELFTYAGSGTLFTREGYTIVRDLALHEFDAAQHLMTRGVAEGFLVERSPAQQEQVLAHAFGVFVEDRYLAGIGALLPHTGERPMGEVVSLYTVTRFVGEGVGGHLLRFARERARTAGFGAIFACTTSTTVEKFFLRHGFAVVGPEAVPTAKWRDYPEARRSALRCLALEIEGDGVAGGGL